MICMAQMHEREGQPEALHGTAADGLRSDVARREVPIEHQLMPHTNTDEGNADRGWQEFPFLL